jgi:S-adenosylmethionine synthetase
MTMEAAAGKNPVNHVGKIYNVIAGRIASSLAAKIPEVSSATCRIVSRIGSPVDDPEIVDIELGLPSRSESNDLREDVLATVAEHLRRVSELQDELLERRIAVY